MPKRTFSTVCGGRNAAFFIVCGPFVTGLDMDVVLLFVIFLVGRIAIFGSSTSNSEGRWPCSVLGRPFPSTSVASISWRRSVLPSINCCSKVTRDSNTDSAVRHREASPVSRWINTFIWSVYSGKFRQNPSMMSLVKVKPSATPPAGQGSGSMKEQAARQQGAALQKGAATEDRQEKTTAQAAASAKYREDGVPQQELERFARFLLPKIQAFYQSEEGQRLFEEWINRRNAEEKTGKCKGS